MLGTDTISQAFQAIIEEAKAAGSGDTREDTRQRLRTIVSIAKHQSDIRDSPKGSCRAHAST